MAKKDDIFKSFLKHDLIKTKYNIDKNDLPEIVSDGLKSEIPIIKTIALIVENLEIRKTLTDSYLRDMILQHLNQSAI